MSSVLLPEFLPAPNLVANPRHPSRWEEFISPTAHPTSACGVEHLIAGHEAISRGEHRRALNEHFSAALQCATESDDDEVEKCVQMPLNLTFMRRKDASQLNMYAQEGRAGALTARPLALVA